MKMLGHGGLLFNTNVFKEKSIHDTYKYLIMISAKSQLIYFKTLARQNSINPIELLKKACKLRLKINDTEAEQDTRHGACSTL